MCSPENPTDCSFTGAEPEPPPAGEPAVTLRDIATFHPAPHEYTAEPAGWAVLDLPANAVADAPTVTRSGSLFSRPVDVRFHPVAYRWVYSDGGTVGSTDPGATWADLGQREFTATPTSHVYRSKGEHTARLDVVYVAEYRFDGSVWRWIDGTLTIRGMPQPVLVGEFDTVLVTGPCTTHPDSPGCG
ncbi:PKD domain-containing protein [Agromyces sp. ZXT2-6]|uniref:PKD domain-containing protein n=1 Tax=Agromyces sp. ZXT2-6 TaxID=3461153 RepID=UPI004055228E